MLGKRGPRRVLDLGCGAGVPIARRLAERYKVTGVDISERQIMLVRRNVPKVAAGTQGGRPRAARDPGVLPRAEAGAFDRIGLHALARARTGRQCSLQAALRC